MFSYIVIKLHKQFLQTMQVICSRIDKKVKGGLYFTNICVIINKNCKIQQRWYDENNKLADI